MSIINWTSVGLEVTPPFCQSKMMNETAEGDSRKRTWKQQGMQVKDEGLDWITI